MIGPPLGGVLVDALNWRWIFGVNIVPLAITLYLTTKLAGDESRRRRAGRTPRGPDGPHRRRRGGAERGRTHRRRIRAHRGPAVGLLESGGARRPGGRCRLFDRVPAVGAPHAASDDAAAHLRRPQLRGRQPGDGVPLRRGVTRHADRRVVPAGDRGPVGDAGGSGDAADSRALVLPGPPVRHAGRGARPSALHGGRSAHRGDRLPADGSRPSAVRLLDPTASRAGGVRHRAVRSRCHP